MAPAQVGFPPTINTEASIGLPRMGYQSSEVAFNLRDADGFLLVYLVGPTSRAHTATKQNVAPRVKVGYFPC